MAERYTNSALQMCVHHCQGSSEELRALPLYLPCKEKEPEAQEVAMTDLSRVTWHVLKPAEAKTQVPSTLANCLCNLTLASERGSLWLNGDLQDP